MKLGVTGSRHGLTKAQRHGVFNFLHTIGDDIEELHHGCCVGADFAMHKLANWLAIPVVGHVPDVTTMMATFTKDDPFHRLMEPRPYLVRNQNIVIAVDWLLVLPETHQQALRSGTWSTYRFAQKQEQTQITIIYPDGSHLGTR